MSATFIKVGSVDPVVEYLSNTLNSHLNQGQKVLWLVSGGSAIPVEVLVAQKLTGSHLGNLTIAPTDERPGPVGHPDSNWHQLGLKGFAVTGAASFPVLNGGSSQDQAEKFGRFLEHELSANDYKVALFGIGPDGHTAGIPALHAEILSGMTALYEAGPFRRISMTPAAIAHLDEAVVVALGESKWPVLDHLTPDSEVSASNLFRAPKLTIFNDRRGDSHRE
jgi:6-phosphogluconolactonase/glucosamine-6-phosphate isomerase/deaminase